MSAIFELVIQSETLNVEELQDITGCKLKKAQIVWLDENGWKYIKNRAGDPIVGRLYARLKLLGISPVDLMSNKGWAPDFSKLQ